MSLINKLLKDLDKRRHKKNAASSAGSGITRQLRPVESESVWIRIGRGGYLVFLLALIVSAVTSIWYLNQLADKAWEEQLAQTFTPVGDKVTRVAPQKQPPAQKKPVAVKPVAKKTSVKAKPVARSAPVSKPEVRAKAKPELAARSVSKPISRSAPVPGPVNASKPASFKVAVKQEDLMRRARNEAQTVYEKGMQLLEQGRIAEAEQAFSHALEIYPPHPDARSALGGLMMDSARWQQASNIFRTGLGIDNKSINFSLGLARSLVEQGNVTEALDVLEEQDDGSVSHGEFLALLAALYQRENEHRDAVETYRRALAAQPYEGRWWMGLGISLEHKESWSQAQVAYESALKDRQLPASLSGYVKQRLERVRMHLPVTLANDS